MMSTTSSHDEPGREATLGHGPVIVGVDGSPNAQRALVLAADMSRCLDTDLVVFHALGLMTVIEGRHVPSEGHRDDIERLLRNEWCRSLQADPSLRWRAEIVYGSPADVLLNMGRDLDASFVVVGSRGVGDEQALGSTSHHVVHHCDRPVVVVPPLTR
jgi:nucleotide-binding universal stress UspA family protein